MKHSAIRQTVFYHFIGWALFIGYELGLSLYSGGQIRAAGRLTLSYILNISLFYVHLVGLRRYFAPNSHLKYLKTAALILAEAAFFLLLKMGADVLLSPAGQSIFSHTDEAGQIISLNLARIIYFIVLSTIFWSAGHISRLQKKDAESKMARMQLELDKSILEHTLTRLRNVHLQQQLNPHLLFNTLNFIYSSVAEHSEEASRGVFLLSEIMRFSMEEADDQGRVPVSRELSQIINLVELNRLRFGHPLSIDLLIEGEQHQASIIPLMLLTLAENMFKHGEFMETPALLHISLSATGRLEFRSRNTKRSGHLRKNSKTLGLRNTRLRLDNYYPGAYSLDITEDDIFFELRLRIRL
jgi:two-component system LytT family sensor kinase